MQLVYAFLCMGSLEDLRHTQAATGKICTAPRWQHSPPGTPATAGGTTARPRHETTAMTAGRILEVETNTWKARCRFTLPTDLHCPRV